MDLAGLDAVEAGAQRFSLVKSKSYILIFRNVDVEGDKLTLHLQRGIRVEKEDLEEVKKNFQVAASRGFHTASADVPSSTAPDTFSALAEAQAQGPKKRTFTSRFATAGVEVTEAATPFHVASLQKRARTTGVSPSQNAART